MFKTVSHDVFIIAEVVVILLDLITFALLIALTYLAFVSGALCRPHQLGANGSRGSRIAEFALVCVVTLATTHLLLHMRWLFLAIVWFVAAVATSFAVYWKRIRAIRRPEDMRVPYVVMVLGTTCLLTFGALVVLWVTHDRVRLETDTKLSIDTLAQIATIAVTAIGVVFTYIMKSDESNRTAKQQIYQTLELQSIDLFRFEASNPKLVEALWDADEPPSTPLDHYQLKQYVCQMLNLFEMAYRFRTEGIMAPTVFGSWVIWIWELSNTSVFRALWADEADGLPLNYVPEFRGAIDLAINAATCKDGRSADAHRKAYFRKLALRVDCEEIEKWLHNAPRKRAS